MACARARARVCRHASPRVASVGPRSKSQASDPCGSSRVGTEARRPQPRRLDVVVETRDAVTQTEGGVRADM